MKTGIDLVADERKRQIEVEGWTPEHDDAHEKCELSNAAACYLANAQAVMMGGTPHPEVMSLWPWEFKWWKPSNNAVRDLVKGLALGVAELDRVLRGLPAIERLLLEEDRRPFPPQEVDRGEDMGGGRLTLFRQEDGDIIVTVYGEKVKGFVERQSVEFCSVGSGGGASPRTMEALRELMRAMDEDNQAPARFGGRAEHGEQKPRPARPRVVCLCGSTRFMDAFQKANLEETIAGRIVLSIGCNTKSDSDLIALGELTEEAKAALDELHKRKIDLADEILVLNVGGYVGSSTRSEIDYARAAGKPVRWLEEPQEGEVV